MNRTDFDALVSDLTAAAAAYYHSDVLLMSDAEYDAGLATVEQTLAEHPDFSTDESDALIEQVAAGAAVTNGDVTHPTRMLSMAKVSALDAGVEADVQAFVAKITGDVVVEPKMDGLALRVEYVEGKLALAATRGDGTTGEDMTDRVLRGEGIKGLPATLNSPVTCEVRGEVYMSVSDFAEAQALRAERGGKAFANPRNATAGSLRKSGEEHWMPMSFAAYDLTVTDREGTEVTDLHTEMMDMAYAVGFMPALRLLTDLDFGIDVVASGPHGALTAINEIGAVRDRLGFEIDGAVIKANDPADRVRLGEGSRTPNWALAYKYPPMEASSVLRDIEVTTGRTGRISLRAVIDPTTVSGSTVTYATLHNPSWVVEQGLGLGSKVTLVKAGDVIPRVTAALGGNDDVTPWVAPETCPKCNEAWNKTSLLWRCETPSCSVAARIDYAASRDCLDIEGLGASVAEALAETETVTNIADLFDLTVDTLTNLVVGTTEAGAPRLLGTTTATKIVAEIEKSKAQSFNRVITALGIRMTGRSVGRWLAAEFPTMDLLRAATVADVASIEKMGERKATSVVNGLADMAEVIDRLAAAGVNMGAVPVADNSPKPLAGMTVVISGAVPAGFRNRGEAQDAIVAAGGKVSGSVSKNTTYLVTDETTTSKAKKADDLGIPVVDPADFAKLLAGEIA